MRRTGKAARSGRRRARSIYVWYDGALLATSATIPTSTPPHGLNTSGYSYDIIGGQSQLTRVDIAHGHPRFVVFRNDMLGQVIRRDEKGIRAPSPAIRTKCGSAIRAARWAISAIMARPMSITPVRSRRSRRVCSSSFADFDLAYDHINAYTQGSNGGIYTIQSGDTLQSIAANLWATPASGTRSPRSTASTPKPRSLKARC